jgi:hypothetical protein
MKFKVGDHVEFIKATDGARVGEKGKVVNVDGPLGIDVQLDRGFYVVADNPRKQLKKI